MNAISYYKFKELLKHKMVVRNGTLIKCAKEYTSKTCENYGILTPKYRK